MTHLMIRPTATHRAASFLTKRVKNNSTSHRTRLRSHLVMPMSRRFSGVTIFAFVLLSCANTHGRQHRNATPSYDTPASALLDKGPKAPRRLNFLDNIKKSRIGQRLSQVSLKTINKPWVYITCALLGGLGVLYHYRHVLLRAPDAMDLPSWPTAIRLTSRETNILSMPLRACLKRQMYFGPEKMRTYLSMAMMETLRYLESVVLVPHHQDPRRPYSKDMLDARKQEIRDILRHWDVVIFRFNQVLAQRKVQGAKILEERPEPVRKDKEAPQVTPLPYIMDFIAKSGALLWNDLPDLDPWRASFPEIVNFLTVMKDKFRRIAGSQGLGSKDRETEQAALFLFSSVNFLIRAFGEVEHFQSLDEKFLSLSRCRDDIMMQYHRGRVAVLARNSEMGGVWRFPRELRPNLMGIVDTYNELVRRVTPKGHGLKAAPLAFFSDLSPRLDGGIVSEMHDHYWNAKREEAQTPPQALRPVQRYLPRTHLNVRQGVFQDSTAENLHVDQRRSLL